MFLMFFFLSDSVLLWFEVMVEKIVVLKMWEKIFVKVWILLIKWKMVVIGLFGWMYRINILLWEILFFVYYFLMNFIMVKFYNIMN